MLVIGYHMLRTNQGYCELGANYLDQLHKDNLRRYHTKRLQNLGFAVTLEPAFSAS